jgi:hypothetical protein
MHSRATRTVSGVIDLDAPRTPRPPARAGMLWLGRYDAVRPLRRRGRFHVYAAEDAGVPVVVVVPGEALPGAAVARALDRLALAHAAVDSPYLAPLHEVGRFDGRPFVAFACDAVLDGELAIARLGERGTRVPYAEAMAAVDQLATAIAAAHAAHDPTTGSPCVFGALAWANVLVGADGRLRLYGLGHNIAALDERGRASGAPAVFVAPEVAAGGPATPAGDVHAFVTMQRALLAYTVPPPALRAAWDGADRAGELAAILRWTDRHVLAARPAERATIGELRRDVAREIELLGLPPAASELRARLASLIAPDDAPARLAAAAGPSGRLTVAHDGRWVVAPDGERHAIVGRADRRVLLALVGRRRTEPGARLDADALVAAGWPGEHVIREAGLDRLYVAISQLRKRGLRDVIERDAGGYRLDPSLPVVVAEEA